MEKIFFNCQTALQNIRFKIVSHEVANFGFVLKGLKKPKDSEVLVIDEIIHKVINPTPDKVIFVG